MMERQIDLARMRERMLAEGAQLVTDEEPPPEFGPEPVKRSGSGTAPLRALPALHAIGPGICP